MGWLLLTTVAEMMTLLTCQSVGHSGAGSPYHELSGETNIRVESKLCQSAHEIVPGLTKHQNYARVLSA